MSVRFIYSFGGYAREFSRCVRQQYPGDKIVFVDDGDCPGAIGYHEACNSADPDHDRWIVGFASAELRKAKTHQILKDGHRLCSVSAATSVIGENVEIGEGAILSDFSMLTADATVGRSFHMNIYSYVAHDCVIGDFVTLAPRVSVNGRVHIHNDAYIGTGATILPGKADKPLVIGEGAIIGAHALVSKDVAANTTVVGIPARPIGATGK